MPITAFENVTFDILCHNHCPCLTSGLEPVPTVCRAVVYNTLHLCGSNSVSFYTNHCSMF